MAEPLGEMEFKLTKKKIENSKKKCVQMSNLTPLRFSDLVQTHFFFLVLAKTIRGDHADVGGPRLGGAYFPIF